MPASCSPGRPWAKQTGLAHPYRQHFLCTWFQASTGQDSVGRLNLTQNLRMLVLIRLRTRWRTTSCKHQSIRIGTVAWGPFAVQLWTGQATCGRTDFQQLLRCPHTACLLVLGPARAWEQFPPKRCRPAVPAPPGPANWGTAACRLDRRRHCDTALGPPAFLE